MAPWSEGASFVSCGWGVGRGVSSCVLVWRLDCSLSTWTVDSQHSMHASFFSFFLTFLKGGDGGDRFKAMSSQVPHMLPQRVPNSTSLLSHMLSSFHLSSWANGKELYTSKKIPSILGSLHNFYLFLSDEPIKLAHCKQTKKKSELDSHLI